MLLIDTNIICSAFLGQQDFITSQKILKLPETTNLKIFITNFAIHSFAILCVKLNKINYFDDFLKLVSKKILIPIELPYEEIPEIFLIMQEIKLDFDDAFQLYISKKHKLQFITLDKDFKKNGIKSFTPKEFLKKYSK